jgi:hypothetical protein
MTSTIIRPIVNINGSSAKDLIEPRMKARDFIRLAIEAMLKVTPNGRDYPGDNSACVTDRIAHYDRIEALSRIGNELMQEAIAIQEQSK